MSTTITKDGLETALSNLQYRNAKQPKTRLIEAIRSFYRTENALETVTEINSDHLIRLVWELDDNPALIKSKRKNLNSIKSTINNDLMNLFHENKNPEGIIIGPLNTFIMSDAAKERLLSSFADSARSQGNLPLEKIADVLSVISEFMSGIEKISSENPKEQVQKILDLIKGMAEKAVSGDAAGTGLPQKMNDGSTLSEGEGTGEMIKDGIENSILDQIEALEEIDEDEIEEIEETELEEIDEAADIEEVDDIDLEEVEEDEISEIEDAAAEEVEEINEDEIKEIEDTEIEAIDGDDTAIEEVDDIDLEEVEADEISEVEDAVVEEVEDIDEDEIKEIEETEIEEMDDIDLEEVEADEISEIEDAAAEEVEEIDEDEIKEIEDTELEEIDGNEAAIEEVDDIDIEEVEADEISEVEDAVVAEEVEEIDDTKLSALDQLGLPQDNLQQKEFQTDKNLLSEQFDGFLGSMERYYNQYLLIPGGQYVIGCKSDSNIDLPEKVISLPDFYIGKYPITNALFEVFVERTGYQTTAEKFGFGWVYSGRFQKNVDSKTNTRSFEWKASYSKEKIKGAFWYQPSGPGSTLHGKRNHPVVQVSFQDAVHFSAWIGKRLCTEFEWEAAARTERGFFYPWGNEWMENACNYEHSAISDTTPVDHYPGGVNSFGVADTLCNVLEWTSDQIKPASGKIREKRYHIAKGGSWISARNIQLSNRFRFESDYTANILGFRCVVD